MSLFDTHGRRFAYLRLSVTEACNFRCSYCLPEGSQARLSGALTSEEIRRLVRAFAGMGVEKVRLTGGEPTLRRDLQSVIEAVAAAQVDQVALTTNGHTLRAGHRQSARELRAWGVDSLNISVDSLDRARFARITGCDRLSEVLAGVDDALSAGFSAVKINAVLLQGENDQEVDRFLDWTRHTPLSVRFIELMRTGDNREYFEKHHVRADSIQMRLLQSGWKRLTTRGPANGPAIEFAHPDHQGTIGLIAPYARDFCASCNRLRVSCQGDLRLCLFGEGDISLRHLLQRDDQREELQAFVRSALERKTSSHLLHEGTYGKTSHLASIGG